MRGRHIDSVNPPLVPVFHSRFPNKSDHAGKLAVSKSPQSKIPSRLIAKALSDGLHRSRPVLLDRLPKRKRLGFQRLQPEPQPSLGIRFEKHADLHSPILL